MLIDSVLLVFVVLFVYCLYLLWRNNKVHGCLRWALDRSNNYRGLIIYALLPSYGKMLLSWRSLDYYKLRALEQYHQLPDTNNIFEREILYHRLVEVGSFEEYERLFSDVERRKDE